MMVTDQDLIRRLDEAEAKSKEGFGQEDLDPNFIARLDAQERGMQGAPQDRAQPPSLLQSMLASTGRGIGNIAIGMEEGGRAIADAPYNITKRFSPEAAKMFAHVPRGSSIAEVLNMTDPSMTDETIRGLAKYGPLAGAAGGASVLGSALGGGISGALLEDDPVMGAGVGAGLGAGLGTLGGAALKVVPKVFKAVKAGIRPTKTLNSLIDKYSKEAIKPISKEGSRQYTSSIGEHMEGRFSPSVKYGETAKRADRYGSPAINDFLADIKSSSTIQNASKLKQQINKEMYSLAGKAKPGKYDPVTADRMQFLERLKKPLNNDLRTSLDKIDPTAGERFLEAEKHWAKNVHPVKTLSSIVEGGAHKIDRLSPAGAKRIAEKILKEAQGSPGSIPKDAVLAAKKIGQQYRNMKTIKKAGLLGAGLGALKGGKHYMVGD